MKENTEQLKNKIYEHIDVLDIPGYLSDEAKKILEYLNYYKLKNIYKHISLFSDYLIYLDSLYIGELNRVLQDSQKSTVVFVTTISEDENDYFLSSGDKDALEDQGLYDVWSKTGFDHHQLLIAILNTKGLLLLSSTEFCNASPTRLSFYKDLISNKTLAQ